VKAILKYLLLNFKSMRFGMFFNQIKPTKENSLSMYICFRRFKAIFPFKVILMRIIHIEIYQKKHFTNDFRKWIEKIFILLEKIWIVEPNAWLEK